ncbi:MAG: hypothetical protein A2X36_09925 [Elusimicrobia bacterium GWA2_69_24]|nr:MAG: hypothetical protein A2X36_09925 [Elusimicrobia bacterium GWA2_69_24]HBL17582.1 chemotaxis protein MotB [Elusimicrobiota bacterium]
MTRLLTLCAAAILLSGSAGCVVSAKKFTRLQSDSDTLKRDLETVRGEVTVGKAQYTDLLKRDAEVLASLSRATGRTEELTKERDQLQQGNQALSQSLYAKQDELSKRISRLQGELSEAQRALAQAQGRNADFEKSLLEANARCDQLKVRAAQLERERDGLLKSGTELSKSLGAKQDELSKTVSSLTAEKRALEGRVEELGMAAEELKVRQERELSETRSTYESLVGELQGEIAQGQVQISQIQGKLSVNVADTIFFDSGRVEIKESGRKVLQRVGDILKHIPDKGIRIEGHTDNLRIRGSLKERFPTNWELSTARATMVARFLQEKAGLDPALLTAAGYSEWRPIAPNETEEGRAKNRRIEIVLIDKELLKPAAQPQTPG